VAGIAGLQEAGREVEGLMVAVSLEQADGALGVAHGVERLYGGQALAVGLLVQVAGIRLLDVGGVAQHDFAQIWPWPWWRARARCSPSATSRGSMPQ
jgi:hypothetical protein